MLPGLVEVGDVEDLRDERCLAVAGLRQSKSSGSELQPFMQIVGTPDSGMTCG